MTTIEKIEKGIITLAEFTEDQQSFIRGIVKLSFNEGLELGKLHQTTVGWSFCVCSKPRETPMINGKYICTICNKSIH